MSTKKKKSKHTADKKEWVTPNLEYLGKLGEFPRSHDKSSLSKQKQTLIKKLMKRASSMKHGLFLLAFWISACSPAARSVSPEQNQSAMAELLTLNAPTETPIPADTPTSTYHSFTAQQAIDAFQAAGLEAVDPFLMEPSDYGTAPLVAVDGIRFFIPSLCEICGGHVFSYCSHEDLVLHKNYFVVLGIASAKFSWLYEKDNLLLQITGDLPKAQAEQYEQALQSLIPHDHSDGQLPTYFAKFFDQEYLLQLTEIPS